MDTNIGIYGFRNIDNGKWYIGSSKQLPTRRRRHLKQLKSNSHPNKHFQNAYNKDVFVYGVLEYCFISDLVDRENFWIDRLKSRESAFGYNKIKALPRNEMTELLTASKGNKHNIGRKDTPETKANKSAAQKLRQPQSEETKAKRIATMTGN